jgi:hypothetical protein
MTSITRRSILAVGTATAATALWTPASTAAAATAATSVRKISVGADETVEIAETTRVQLLSIAGGGSLTAPDGYSLTMTVDGVETGAVLPTTYAPAALIAPGTYRGDIVLTVAADNPVTWFNLVFPIRQALYVGADGVVKARSALAGVTGGQVTDAYARNIAITSTGEAFNGVYVAGGGAYTLDRPRIAFDGNGRCDFVGYGAGIVGTGSGTTLVVDGADIHSKGAVRPAVVADDGANVIVKNSRIRTRNGVLPDDYQASVFPAYMMSAPWMLSISGNNRATNCLGTNTRATYINSTVASESWGVLSTDSDNNAQLTAIASTLTNTGDDGYGTYADGTATVRFLGTAFDVASYAAISTGGDVVFGDSSRERVAQLNTDLELGLTARELAAIPVRRTTVNSRRFGVMWHQRGGGSVDISGGTVLDTAETTFLDKGQQVTITVDGSEGARLNPRNGILLQMMENDDPGPVVTNGVPYNTGVYTEPTSDPVKDTSFDVSAAHDADTTATFTDIALTGDFYNGMRNAKNLVLTLTGGSRLRGVVSASRTEHAIATIASAEYRQLGEVTNTTQPAVNNGVLVRLGSGSRWTVTGTSYLTGLAIASDAALTAPSGRSLSLTVDGAATTIAPGGTYTGALVLTVV